MKKSVQRGLMLATASCLAAAASAAPVPLDTEQTANMAAGMGLRMARYVPLLSDAFVDRARGLAYRTLRQLNATTTPEEVLAAPGGLTFACGTSGTLKASLSRKLPRVLKVTWTACKFQNPYDYPRDRNGVLEVTLPSDTFAPQSVSSIRVGERDRDFTDFRHIEDEEQITDEKTSLNMRLRGDIAMTRAFPPNGRFIGPFNFEATGFVLTEDEIELPGTGLPLIHTSSSLTGEKLVISGSVSYDETWRIATVDFKARSGSLRSFSHQDGYPDASHAISPSNFRFHAVEDYGAWSRVASFEGKVQVQNPTPRNEYTVGCIDGVYAFKSVAPLVGAYSDNGRYESGGYKANGAAVSFYSAANVPPGLPAPEQGMLTRLKVPGVGRFVYDSPHAGVLGILDQNGQCSW